MKHSVPKVCIIISSFYPNVNGAERQAYLLARELIKGNIEVCVLTRRYRGLAYYELIDSIPVYRMPAPGNRIIASLVFTFSSLIWLTCNREHWSVLHAFQLLSPTTIAILGKVVLGGRIVARMACSSGGGTQYGDVNRMRQAPLMSLRRRLLHYADVFVVLNEEGRRDLVEFGLENKPIHLIPNGVDTQLFCPKGHTQVSSRRQALGLPGEGKLVIFVGRLDHSKGIELLLKAWRRVLEQVKEEVHIAIIGAGALRSQLEIYGVDQYVHFLGRRDNVADYLQVSDIFVLPSLAEGMSNALLEAMACGLPVVATAVAGTQDLVEDGVNGMLVPPDDEEALYEALLFSIRHLPRIQGFGMAARQRIADTYSIDAVVGQYVDLYASMDTLEVRG